MFGPRPISSGLSFGKVLGGISKTLGVVNQVIPLYKETKPMIQNARNAFSLIKEFSNTSTNRIMSNTEKNVKQIKEKIQTIELIEKNTENKKGPTFFL